MEGNKAKCGEEGGRLRMREIGERESQVEGDEIGGWDTWLVREVKKKKRIKREKRDGKWKRKREREHLMIWKGEREKLMDRIFRRKKVKMLWALVNEE
jgi:3-phenylpropionate/cinnamic acid dioxygenase small subunit